MLFCSLAKREKYLRGDKYARAKDAGAKRLLSSLEIMRGIQEEQISKYKKGQRAGDRAVPCPAHPLFWLNCPCQAFPDPPPTDCGHRAAGPNLPTQSPRH